MKSERLPQLDVLRGVAILLVLMFHPAVQYRSPAEVPWIASALFHVGWTGVNLFFVLSGYLVGGMLLAETERRGKVDLRRFLVRRALKIWPSYYVLLAVTAIVALRVGHDLSGFWPLLVHAQNYSNAALELLPHSWSLAVEEHFYLILPLAMAAIPRGHRGISLVVGWAFLAVACTVVRAIDRPTFPTFPTHHNLDALAWGVVLAHITSARSKSGWVARSSLWVPLGIVLLILAFCCGREGSMWSSALNPTGLYIGYGLVLLGIVGLPAARFRGWLARVTAFVGFYSYSIYLWHPIFPLVVVRLIDSRAEASGMTSWGRWFLITSIYTLLAVGVGVLMSRTIEQPMLALRDRLAPRRARSVAVASTIGASWQTD